MFVYGADFFALKPGMLAARARAAADGRSPAFGPVEVGPVTLSLYSMLFGLIFTVIGLQGVFLGCIAQVLFDYTGEATARWMRRFPYTRTVGAAAALFAARGRSHPAAGDRRTSTAGSSSGTRPTSRTTSRCSARR